jgi:hypothetical protein
MPLSYNEIIVQNAVNTGELLTRDQVEARMSNNFSDFTNLFDHSAALGQKNLLLSSTRLHVIKNREVMASQDWNDIHVFENLNKTSTFNNEIREYKEHLSTLQWENSDYFRSLAYPSKRLMDATLSLIYYTEGHAGLNALFRGLPQARPDLSFSLPDFLPVYNSILYFAPYFLWVAASNGDMNVVMHTPYECVCLDLKIYIQDFSATNSELNFISRAQLRLEANYLPDVGYIRDLYNLHVENRIHNLNIVCRLAGNHLRYYGPRVGVPILLGALRYVLDAPTEQALVVSNNERQIIDRQAISTIAELLNEIIWPT